MKSLPQKASNVENPHPDDQPILQPEPLAGSNLHADRLAQLLRAGVYEVNPSANRDHIDPAIEAFGNRVVIEALLQYVENGNDFEKSGAINSLYWTHNPTSDTVVKDVRMRTMLVSDASTEIQAQMNKLILREPTLELVGTTSSSIAEKTLQTHKPQVVWIDFPPDAETGLLQLETLINSFPRVYFVASHCCDELELIARAFKLGASDFIFNDMVTDFPLAVAAITRRHQQDLLRLDFSDPLWLRQKNLLLKEFVSNENMEVQQSIISHLILEHSGYPRELWPVVDRAIEIAMSHKNEYIRNRAAFMLADDRESIGDQKYRTVASLPERNSTDYVGI